MLFLFVRQCLCDQLRYKPFCLSSMVAQSQMVPRIDEKFCHFYFFTIFVFFCKLLLFFYLFVHFLFFFVVAVAHIYPPVAGNHQKLNIGRSEHFLLQ